MPQFQLVSEFQPAGDQPQAIEALVRGIEQGKRDQVLLGVTGSGKTFTMANVIARLQRPTLVLSHNKTLAAQLFSEFREFFPNNAVAYFVSYYDYYQPEAYIPQRDIYIEKDASINEEIDRLRLSATSALVSRRDTIVVATVSCIYGLGSPKDYLEMMIPVRRGESIDREEMLRKLIDIQYDRNDIEMLAEVGYCPGIENYSRPLAGRKPGEPPYTLFDFFPKDALMFVDESHATAPQVRAMFAGDRSRKTTLVEHGFRLPCALDNRPLTFDEWRGRGLQTVFVSATPADWELEQTGGEVVEQVIRPTGLIDPVIHIAPARGQVQHLTEQIRARAA